MPDGLQSAGRVSLFLHVTHSYDRPEAVQIACSVVAQFAAHFVYKSMTSVDLEVAPAIHVLAPGYVAHQTGGRWRYIGTCVE